MAYYPIGAHLPSIGICTEFAGKGEAGKASPFYLGLFRPDGNHPRFDFFRFRQCDGQNAVLELSIRLVRDHADWKRYRAFKRTPTMFSVKVKTSRTIYEKINF